jgi:hypothetical protein
MKRKHLDGIPKSLRIGNIKYEILIVRPSENYGRQYGTGWIEIGEDQETGVRAIETVIHEVTHAIYDAYVIRAGDDEERTVTTLAKGWAQVYYDNPALLRWMAKAAK